MDQNSGRSGERAVPGTDGPGETRPVRDDEPAPAPAPLPRRSAQQHMEPRLRRHAGAGADAGSAFTAFAPGERPGTTAVFGTSGSSAADRWRSRRADHRAPAPGDEEPASAAPTAGAGSTTRARHGQPDPRPAPPSPAARGERRPDGTAGEPGGPVHPREPGSPNPFPPAARRPSTAAGERTPTTDFPDGAHHGRRASGVHG